jgi:hypothetical protein
MPHNPNAGLPAWAYGHMTYRQLDHWTRQGWVKTTVEKPGSGFTRDWPRQEQRVALLMGAIINQGTIKPDLAHRLARAILEDFDRDRSETVSIKLGRNLQLVVSDIPLGGDES